MSADDTSAGTRQIWREASEDGWALAQDLTPSPGYRARRSGRQSEKPARPAQRESLDEALRGLFKDCPVPPHLEQFIRDLEDCEDPPKTP